MVENGGVDVESHQQPESAGGSNSLDLDLSSLPKNCLPLVHQVAGHFYGKGRTKLGLLQTNDGLVLKPVQSPPRGEREHQFYKDVFLNADCQLNSDQLELRKFLPAYRGSLTHNQSNTSRLLFLSSLFNSNCVKSITFEWMTWRTGFRIRPSWTSN